METQSKIFTAEKIKSAMLFAQAEKLKEIRKGMSIEETVLHMKQCDSLKQLLLFEAHNKALKGEDFHAINVTNFFETDGGANIELILSQLDYELTLLGYKVTVDSIFAHAELQSYKFIKIEW